MSVPSSFTEKLEGETPKLKPTGIQRLSQVFLKFQPIWMLIICTALAIGHHLTCKRFSGREAVPVTIFGFTIRQEWVFTIINTFSALVHLLLPASLSGASIQTFWHKVDALKKRANGISDVEKSRIFGTIINPWSKDLLDSPIRPNIKLISTLAILLIPIFANPSLTVHPESIEIHNCPVTSLSLAAFNLADVSKSGVSVDIGVGAVAVKTLISGSYLTPESPCGDCFYNTTFWGPALNCIPTNNATFPPDLDGQTVFWNSQSLASKDPGLTVMSKADSQSAPDIVECHVLNGTYNVQVNHSIPTSFTTSVIDLSPYPSNGTEPVGHALDGLLSALSVVVQGPSSINNTDSTLIQPISLVAYSPFGSFDINNGSWILNDDLSHLMEGLMQNFTLSLLAGINSDSRSILRTDPSACYVNTVVYTYQPLRLWLTYGIALGISLLTIVATHFKCRSDTPRTLSLQDLVENLNLC